jgi:hypothetical protein
MTSCQRPKECEPSRYRHGSDPPKQVQTASLANSRRTLFPSSTQSSFGPFTYIRSKIITESQAERCRAPSQGRSLPCHHLRSLWLFQMQKTKLYFFCMPSMQLFGPTDTVTFGVQRCLLTGSRFIKVEGTSLAPPESIQHLFESEMCQCMRRTLFLLWSAGWIEVLLKT